MGVILGHGGYMSPEQARGASVDRRADIWAFGAVLYELLAGKRLIDEPTASDALAAVSKSELNVAALPAETPPHIRRLIGRCLERDPKLRLRDIGEARIMMDRPDSVILRGSPPVEARKPRTGGPAPLASLAMVSVAALVLGIGWYRATRPAPSTNAATLTIARLASGAGPQV